MYKVDTSTVLKICAQEGEFYLAEIESEGKGIYLWIARSRVFSNDLQALSVLTACGREKQQGVLLSDCEVFYGPGEEYAFRNQTLQKGTLVTAFEA